MTGRQRRPGTGRVIQGRSPRRIRKLLSAWSRSWGLPISSAAAATWSGSEARRAASIQELVFEWNDVFDIDINPAVSADEGLKIGPEIFGRLSRMK
ncbi:MAG: hypothetical protein ACLP3Q_15740 [Streptosporangiaceae bacterium]